MSWWNTSNFTDLASKALKNAQKKIDKALDISEEESAAKLSQDAAVANEKEKGDFWSGWTVGTGSDAQDSKSAWSFPWGGPGEVEEEKKSEDVREKTAEEIKSEVLKAAKERSKAKAKLFPKSKSSEQRLSHKNKASKESVSEEQRTVPDETQNIGDAEEARKLVSASPNESDKNVQSTFPLQEVPSHEIDPGVIQGRTEVTVVKESDALPAEVSYVEEDLSEVALLNENPENTTPVHSANDEEDYKDLKVTEMNMSGSAFQEIMEKEVEKKIISEAIEVSNEDAKSGETSALNTDTIETHSEHKDTLSTRSLDLENNTIMEPDLGNFSKEISDCDIEDETISAENKSGYDEFKEKLVSLTGDADISSSVEFVTESDLNVVNTVSNVIADSDNKEQIGSDPEIVDCDKYVSEEEIPEDKIPECVTEGKKLSLEVDTSFEYDKADNVEFKNAEVSESASDTLLLKTYESETRTESSKSSEADFGRLDTSLETSASDETIVNQSPKPEIDVTPITSEQTKPENPEFSTKENNIFYTSSETEGASVMETQEESVVPTDSDIHESLSKAELSPANSFVKCMLEDVIDEVKHEDNSDSLSGNSKSDGSRSIYSNHESSDEIDTTTSSDIEIISLPTPNGDNRQISPLDPLPLRIALQKTSWRGSPTHKRTDSSGSSKDGGSCELSPGRDNMDYQEYPRSHHEHGEGQRHMELPALDEEDDNPYHPQRLLKDEAEGSCDPQSHVTLSGEHHTDLQQKLAEMSEVLQAREAKLLQLSKDNCDLMETNSILSNQLKQSEEAREAEMTDVNELTAEFTARLTEAEKRVTSAIRDRDGLKKQLQEAQNEIAKRAGDTSLKQLLAEKEEQIEGLLQEGEKLSKSQLQSNTIIKKLRQKEKDNESTITSQKKKLDTQKEELDHLHKVLESKEELEKKQTEAISQLTSAVNKQEQEMVRLKSEHEDSLEKVRGLQAALDNSYKEMAELHRNTAVMDSKAQEAALSAEMQVREELKMTIEKQTQDHKWEKDSLSMQIEDMRLGMARMEKEHNRREELLRQEIADLQKQLQEDEARTQELTQGVSLATRPLLRQIENLQSNYNAQTATWEKVEKNLSDRLGEAQNSLAVSMEKERTANEQVMDLSSKVTSLETQTARLRQEKSTLTAQLEVLRTKVELSEDAKQHEAAQIEVLKQQMSQEISELKKQKLLLETQLDVEKSRVDQEKKKISMLQDQIRDLEYDVQRSKSRGTPGPGTPSPVSVSRQDSMVSSLHDHSFSAITQDELDRSFVLSSPNGNKQSLYEALRQSGAANLLENLQSQLKMREGEISHLQSEIRNLERTRESMAKELVDLSNQNDELEEKVKNMPELLQQHKDLDQRYNALLQMYGEKVEETNELRLDLQDVKDMYKAQINQLLGQSG